jgi:O-acetyl-ADP-ribose deacetylase (regulator of RNase III)
MPHHIILGDLSTFKVDVIVNSAHSYPVKGTGVDQALYRAGGEALFKARQSFGHLNAGDCVKTPAFNLDAQAVYHVITPHVDSKASSKQLKKLYTTVFNQAINDHYQTIALPLLASGNHGFNRHDALVIAKEAIVEFLNEHEIDISLVIYDKAQVQREIPHFEEPIPELMMHHMAMLEASFNETAKSFHQWLFDYIDAHHLEDPWVYKKANITRQHFSKIRSNQNYQPTKYTVIALVLALELNLDQTYDFLETAGFTLSSSLLFDRIIEYHIDREIYDVFEINEVLFLYDQRILG